MQSVLCGIALCLSDLLLVIGYHWGTGLALHATLGVTTLTLTSAMLCLCNDVAVYSLPENGCGSFAPKACGMQVGVQPRDMIQLHVQQPYLLASVDSAL